VNTGRVMFLNKLLLRVRTAGVTFHWERVRFSLS
jgi:hypothetical protein